MKIVIKKFNKAITYQNKTNSLRRGMINKLKIKKTASTETFYR